MTTHHAKEGIYFVMQPEDIIKSSGYTRLGRFGTGYAVEDPSCISTYESLTEATEHYNDNLRIDATMAEE